MKRWLPHPVLTPVLTIVWLLLNNTLELAHILLGLALGWIIPRFTLAFWPERVRFNSLRAMLRFATAFFYDVVVANFAVARLILAGPRCLRPRFVTLPLAISNEFAISVLVNTICLTPGTVSARLSADRSRLLLHVLDCDDPAALIAEIKQRFEAPLKEILEC